MATYAMPDSCGLSLKGDTHHDFVALLALLRASYTSEGPDAEMHTDSTCFYWFKHGGSA